jgi:hypothetical protein
LLDSGQLTKAQLGSVDSLLLQLDQFEGQEPLPVEAAKPAPVEPAPAAPAAPRRKSHLPTIA